ncbi:RagB/SusD family nutrient uptake outer membrane protein [Niabella aquatica]
MKILNIYTLIIVGLLTFSCQRNFDEPNPDMLTNGSFWKTESDAIKGINAVYSAFNRSSNYYNRWMHFLYLLRSDEGFGSGGDIGLNNNMAFAYTSNNTGSGQWNAIFHANYRANQVIAYVPQINMDETLKRRVIAEAKFLRALNYFNLVVYWGRPPLVLEVMAPTDYPANATPQQVYAQIEKDLTEALADLPATYAAADIGRATKGAAHGLLAKAYMQQGKFNEAKQALDWLVTGAGAANYGLMDSYADNFKKTTENNRESVFEIQFKENPAENGDDDTNLGISLNTGISVPKFLAPPAPGPGYADGAARRWIIDSFNVEKTATNGRDPRVAVSFLYDYADERGPAFTNVYGATWQARYGANDKRVWFRKLLNDHWRNTESFSSPNNYRMIRYADILLMYAECLNEAGQTANAYQYVDRVRTRVNMSPLATIKPGMNQTDFRQQIKHERMLELAGEGWRYFDMVRWGELSNNLAVLKARDADFNNFVPNKHEWYPIPQSDIDNSNLTQNPNY